MDGDRKTSGGSPGSDSSAEKEKVRKLADELNLSRAALGDADLERIIGADGSAADMLLSPADSDDGEDGCDSGSPLSLPQSVFEDTEEGLSVNFALPSPAHHRGTSHHNNHPALLYTTSNGERRIRVLTLSLQAVSSH